MPAHEGQVDFPHLAAKGPLLTQTWGPDTPATGKPFSFKGVTFMRVENGKIVYQGDWYDSVAAPTDRKVCFWH